MPNTWGAVSMKNSYEKYPYRQGRLDVKMAIDVY